MESVPTRLPESIVDDGAQASPQLCHLVSTGSSLLQGMEDIHTLFEPAPETSHSIYQEQVFCSYEVHHINTDTSTTPSSPTAAETLRGTVDYVQNNRPVMCNPFLGVMSPFQGPMWSPPLRDFPPAVYPIPQKFHSFSPSGPRVWDSLPPIQFSPRAPGASHMMNMGFLSNSPQFGFSSGPCMLIKIPEFCHEAYFPSRQLFFRPEGCPRWCLCPMMEPVNQTCRPELVYRTRESMVQNDSSTSEDKWPNKAEEEHPQMFTPYKTKLRGGPVSSEPLVAFQDQLQTHWTREDNQDVPNSICPKEGSILDTDDLSCLLPSDLDPLDHYTLEDLEALIKESSDSLFNRKDTPPPPAKIERIIQYLRSGAPITEYEPNSEQNEQDLPANEKPRRGWHSSFPLQQSPLEGKSADQYESFSPDHHFEKNMTYAVMG
ncbi:hypothetical protein CHARACLAT_007154 [Characodon lateralis]|uniref:Uncharacterized protein n=1 Tax=Characodon lateralis TaxID=208331 RepID=A0ABU7EIT1_9TELE|nr:hypothetical protein [Characodon lateralis]